MLQVEGLSKKYGKTLANDDLSFKVDEGAISVLAGPNGAGKSTAIRAIAGLLRYKGSISIGGHPNKSVEAKRLLGYVAETPAVYGMLTIWEHMEFIARAYDMGERWAESAQALLTRFELDDKKKKFGKELSKGMQQKLSICCALLSEPKLLLVDEPFVGLDPKAIKTLKEVFKEQKQLGTSVLISTHMLGSVEELWDELLILVNGKIAATRLRGEGDDGAQTLEELFFCVTESDV